MLRATVRFAPHRRRTGRATSAAGTSDTGLKEDVVHANRQHLIDLARAGRTGALHIGGAPGGTVYLVAGRISYAESPASRGLGERLVGSGRLPAAVWQHAYQTGRRTSLLRDGWLGPGELHERLAATIADATHEALRGDGPAWFVNDERHWLAGLASVRSRVSKNMTHIWCDPRSQRARKMAHCDGGVAKIPPKV